jgi:Bacteriophage replication gene A protein (GPA)
MGKGLTYGQFVGATMDCLRADFRDCIIGAPLTPIHDVVAPHLARLPADISAQLKRDFWRRHEGTQDWSGKDAAQGWLQSEVAAFEAEKLHIAFDDQEIRARAKRWAEICGKMMSLEVMQDFARSVGVAPPLVDLSLPEPRFPRERITRVSAANRLKCEMWWRRAMRRAYTQRAESHMVAAGFVHRKRQVYASDRCVEHKAQRKRADREMLQAMVAVCDSTGEQLELWEVVQGSQANPKLRRDELMARLRGFEGVARDNGHVAEFVTLTCPSAFHRTLSNGSKNPLWEGFNPRQGQAWLSKMWARARAKLQRISVLFYGFRVAEPHHDGTPHWHMVLFVPSSGVESLRAVLRGVWLSEYAGESGASSVRVSFTAIDPSKGSAAGYLAKYVAKNIDGYQVGADHETAGQDAAKSVDRVTAWASAHHIRQFQQIGGPAVSLWRELRRVRTAVVDNAPLEAARKAADEGDWSGFVAACGGITAGKHGPLGLIKERSGELSQYGELRGPQVVGISSACGSVRTREKVWRIERKQGACNGRLSAENDVGAGSATESSREAGRFSGWPDIEPDQQCRKRADDKAAGAYAGIRECLAAEDRAALITESAGQWKAPSWETRGHLGVSGSPSAPLSLSELGPVSTTVRGTESRNRGEVKPQWHPTQ